MAYQASFLPRHPNHGNGRRLLRVDHRKQLRYGSKVVTEHLKTDQIERMIAEIAGEPVNSHPLLDTVKYGYLMPLPGRNCSNITQSEAGHNYIGSTVGLNQ